MAMLYAEERRRPKERGLFLFILGRTSLGEEGAEALIGILSLALLSEITIGLR